MKIEGTVTPPRGKKNKYWAVEIPLLEIFTQGKSREDAYFMAKDAIECLVDKKSFKVAATPGKGNSFTVSSEDHATFIAFVLGRLRSAHHLTARQVAVRLQSSSPNAYARYERGKAMPKLDTLIQLLKAINPRLELLLKTV